MCILPQGPTVKDCICVYHNHPTAGLLHMCIHSWEVGIAAPTVKDQCLDTRYIGQIFHLSRETFMNHAVCNINGRIPKAELINLQCPSALTTHVHMGYVMSVLFMISFGWCAYDVNKMLWLTSMSGLLHLSS